MTEPEPLLGAGDDADVWLWRRFLADADATALLRTLRRDVRWDEETITVFGKTHVVPRLVAWYGDAGARYRYAGVDHAPLPWTPALAACRDRVAAATGARYNSVLLNLYRDGADGMGWHSDDEPELGPEPVIASLSLGAARRFRLRRRDDSRRSVTLDLPHGSLLLMRGATQRCWRHMLAKTRRPVAARINLTFRRVGC